MNISDFEKKLNKWGQECVPFLFLIDFEMENPEAWRLHEVPKEISFSLHKFSNEKKKYRSPLGIAKAEVRSHPITYEEYKTKFDHIKKRIAFGDSYLTNLTVKTKVELNQSLEELYSRVSAKYKVCWKDKFLVFSPETFVKIENKKIFSFPMKGTIEASIENAEMLILADTKERAEHITIVDLIRNDLSGVATNVNVKRFRYIDKIKTHQKDLLQVSSEIYGDLPDNYSAHIGSILLSLLPAGSVSGAPKNKTVQIIREVEKEKRGYYTGVVGCFDGTNLDSGVMIRFIEQEGNQFYYRSGGGITSQSRAESEYQEILNKIYVPVY
ncbi:MAG: aminodeoxychorismate synthase component I [Bacteroidetes bacterium]|nr:aminodeoxychorismate synthase component I [Bacteroidota bacterium]